MDYLKTKIYKIESHLGDKIYIGSTTKDFLSQRMAGHRSKYNRWKAGKDGKTSSFDLFEEYGINNCKITLIELYPCNSKDEKNARESHFIKELNCVNVYNPYPQGKKVYAKDSESTKAYAKKYYDNHKQKMICECGVHCMNVNFEVHKISSKHVLFMENKTVII